MPPLTEDCCNFLCCWSECHENGCPLNLLTPCGKCIDPPAGSGEPTAARIEGGSVSSRDSFITWALRDDSALMRAARVLMAMALKRLRGHVTTLPVRKPAESGRLGMDVDNVFTYHPPFGDQTQRYENIRNAAKGLALLIQDTSHPSREQAMALTHLQQAVMCANAAIAVNEAPPDA